MTNFEKLEKLGLGCSDIDRLYMNFYKRLSATCNSDTLSSFIQKLPEKEIIALYLTQQFIEKL